MANVTGTVNGCKTKSNRWIRISVEMLEHDVLAGPYDRRSAWLWLIANAAWTRKEIEHKGRTMVLDRGQVLAGRKFLAQQWKWTEQSVRTFIAQLSNQSMVKINQSNGHLANLLTICNYDKYQTLVAVNNQSANQSAPEINHTSTLDTSYTIKGSEESSVTSVSPRTARTDDDAARPDLDFIESRVRTAAGQSLNPLAVGLFDLAEVLGWIKNGADLETDIVPAIIGVARKTRPQIIESWRYFAKPVAEAVKRRKDGLPAVAPVRQPKRSLADVLSYKPLEVAQ